MVLFYLNDEDITDEYIIYNHNFLKDKIKNALEIIKDYIIQNNLLIVGGTAIDYALKLKNDKIYNDLYQIPDFDIISPNNVDHANNIGKILCNMKYDNISIIPAIHQTTIRVQLLGFTLFDSTFIPQNIYDKIPYLEFNEIKFVDPNFQKINQYLSLSLLYKITGPSYNILNRFQKDISRLDKLNKYYILETKDSQESYNTQKFNLDISLFNLNNINIFDITNNQSIDFNNNFDNLKKYINKYIINNDIYYNINSNFIFHGTLAYNIIYMEFTRIYNKLSSILPLNNNDKKIIQFHYNNIVMKLGFSISNNNIIFDLCNDIELCLINSQSNESKYGINELLKKFTNNYNINNIKNMGNILDLIPPSLQCDINTNNEIYNLKIFDLYGELIGINLIYIDSINKHLPISNYNYNLMYFLVNYFLESNEKNKNIYLNYYISLYSMVNIIQYLYYNYTSEFESSESFINSCFNFSINTSGEKNYPDNYHYFLSNFKHLVKNNKNLNILPPKNYIGYPNCTIKNIFDKKKSIFYSDIQVELSNLGISGINNTYENI